MSADMHSAADAATKVSAAVLTPVERLELSRARMRVFLERGKAPAADGSGLGPSSIGAKVSAWADGLRENPLMGAVIDAVRNWWMSHPLHSVSLMAGDAVEDIAVPWIRRYPLAVVGGALAVGAVAAKLKPWRWLGKPALFAGLASQIAGQLMTHAPLEFLIDTFTNFAKPKKAPTTDVMSTPPDDQFGIDPASSMVPPVATVSTRNDILEPMTGV